MIQARDFCSREFFASLTELKSGYLVRVNGPAIIRANGLRVAALGGMGTNDFGAIALFYAPSVPTPEINCLRFSGNLAYLPYGGSWYVFQAFTGTPSPASVLAQTDLISFTVFENAPLELYEAMTAGIVPSRCITTFSAVVGVTKAIDSIGATDSYGTGGSVITEGDYFSIIGVSICNVGANPGFVFWGNGGLAAANGIRLAANTNVIIPVGNCTGMSSLYSYANLITTFAVTWSLR